MPRLDVERIALWRDFCVLSTTLQRRIDTELTDEHEMSLAWYDVLNTLRLHDAPMRVNELCAALREVPSSLSRRLDRMEEEDLIERATAPLPDDRRAVVVSLTTEGRLSWRDANITYRRLVQQHFAQHLTESDLAALQRVWAKLAQ